MDTLLTDFFREGGYVSERNQLQENPRVFIKTQGCGEFTDRLVPNREEIELAEFS